MAIKTNAQHSLGVVIQLLLGKCEGLVCRNSLYEKLFWTWSVEIPMADPQQMYVSIIQSLVLVI